MKIISSVIAIVAVVYFGGAALANGANNNCNGRGSCATTNTDSSVNNTNRNTNQNTNRNRNTNRNSNEQSQGQRQGQAQGQAQGQKQSAEANNSGNSQTTNFEAAASSAALASISPTATCQVPVTIGVGVVAANAGFGTTYTSEPCVQQEQTRFVCAVSTQYRNLKRTCVGMIEELDYVKKYRAKAHPVASASPAYAPATFTPTSMETE